MSLLMQNEEPQRSLNDLQNGVSQVDNVRDQAIVVLQLKLGLRAGEISSIHLTDVSLDHDDLQSYYPDLGTNSALKEHENAVYIPHDRGCSKSVRPRVLPLDDEARQALVQYLQIRPDNGDPRLFVSIRSESLARKTIRKVWKESFQHLGDETEGITSYDARRWFTEYWLSEPELTREQLKYLRGDTLDPAKTEEGGAGEVYIYAYYEDVEDRYLENVFKLDI